MEVFCSKRETAKRNPEGNLLLQIGDDFIIARFLSFGQNVTMAAKHKFLKFILPGRAFAAIRTGTRLWMIECPCGHKRDLWDAGGIRYKAVGEPWSLCKCPECGKGTMHKIRKKTEAENEEIEVSQGGGD